MSLPLRPRRCAATLAVVAVVSAGLAACGANEDTSTDDRGDTASSERGEDALTLSATWLAAQADGGIAQGSFEGSTFPDYSLTVDIATALLAADEDEEAQELIDALAGEVDAYLAPGFGTTVSAGSTAKLAHLVQESDGDATSFGAQDLVAQLEGTVSTQAPTEGRIADEIDPAVEGAADYANTFGQAYAVAVLTEADSDLAASATSFLLDQQCSDGSFRLYFSAPDAEDQSCDSAQAEAEPSVDATALAVLALLDSDSAGAEEALSSAADWLVSLQGDSGGLDDAEASVPIVANANSVGLAAQALGEAGDEDLPESAAYADAAASAAGWIAENQVTDATIEEHESLAGQAGAIAYDEATRAAAEASGIEEATLGQWRLATAQAAPGLAWLD